MIAAYFHVVSDIERIGDHAEKVAELAFHEMIVDGFHGKQRAGAAGYADTGCRHLG